MEKAVAAFCDLFIVFLFFFIMGMCVSIETPIYIYIALFIAFYIFNSLVCVTQFKMSVVNYQKEYEKILRKFENCP